MIICDYCTLEISAASGPDRHIVVAINRPPDPAPAPIDLHARCVDGWVDGARKVKKPK